MGRNNCGRQRKSVLIIILSSTFLITAGGLELDLCTSERNCSIQLSNSASLQCTVGHKQECDSIKRTEHVPDQGVQDLYPYLATIAIYKRLYRGENEFHVEAFNFSFIVPQTEISANGTTGVMAEFREAPGYNNNSYYKEPVCRVFNWSRSSTHLLDTFGTQTTSWTHDQLDTLKTMSSLARYIIHPNPQLWNLETEIPYSCIGINIYPSVFHVTLMSLPSSHRLNYVVSWHEKSYGEYESFYNFYEEPGHVTQKSVWVEQLIAVAAVQSHRLIHAVFQLPRSGAGVSFFKVSLVERLQTITSKQVGLTETSVTFTDVPPGQYKVIIQPHGGVCDIDLTMCAEIASESVNVSQHHDAALAKSTNDALTVVMSICAVVVIFIILGTLALLIIKKHWKKRELESNEIYITSLASRELEKQVTSYFCSFLSVALHTSVIFTLPLLHPGKLKVINVPESTNEAETQQNLLQSSHLEKSCRCCIILQFSYSAGYCQVDNVSTESEGQRLENSVYSQNHNLKDSNAVNNSLRKISSKQTYFVTFKQESVLHNAGIAYTIHEGSVNSVNSEDQITVLNGAFRKPSHIDNISQRNGSLAHRIYNQHVKEYCLPCDIYDLYEDLRSCLGSKVETPSSEIIKIEYWKLAVTVFHKAAEHPPDHYTPGNKREQGVDVRTHTQTTSETDYIQHNLQESRLLEYTRQFCNTPGLTESAYQIHACDSDRSLIAPLCAVENFLFNSTSSEIKKLHGILQTNDRVTTFTTPNDQKYMLLKSVPRNRHGSVCSCDSYSNLTEAENDIEQQCIINQRRTESSITQPEKPLTNGQYPCICPHGDTFSSKSNTLPAAIPHSRTRASR